MILPADIYAFNMVIYYGNIFTANIFRCISNSDKISYLPREFLNMTHLKGIT